MHKLLSNAWIILIFVLTLFWAYYLGRDIHAQDWKEVTLDAIMLAFWIFFAVLAFTMRVKEAKIDAEFEAGMKDAKEKLDALLEEMSGLTNDEKLAKEMGLKPVLEDALRTVATDEQRDNGVKDHPFTKEQLDKVKAIFEEETSHAIKLKQGKGGLAVEINAKHDSATKKAKKA